MPPSQNPALTFLESNYDRFIAELQEFLSIPSISSDESHTSDVQQAANWIADRIRVAGMEQVEVIPTEGHPIVYGESLRAGMSAPTVLIYGHYDVQPPDPLSDWKTPPFVPTIVAESLFARGATDMKGPLMASVAAIEAMIQSQTLQVNIKFLIEGEEEVGSVNLSPFVAMQPEQLACDCILTVDAGEMSSRNNPVITYSLRGGAVFKLQVFGPREDIHSGLFGGMVHNPIHALSAMIAGLHDSGMRVMLPDFYQNVRELDVQERIELAGSQLGEDFYRQRTGVSALWGEYRYIPEERVGARPSMDVVEFQGGHAKAAIPAKATALVFFRLVPDQDPNDVHQQFRRYLEACAPATVAWQLEYVTGFPALLINRSSKGIHSMENALETAFEKKPKFCRLGGSIPAILMLQQALRADAVLTGFSLIDDNLHGPNEKIDLPTWKRGTIALIYFFRQLLEAG